MPPWLQEQLNQVRQNPRLRGALWLIAGILLLYANLVVSDWRAAVRADSEDAADRLARLDRIEREGDWQARAEEARSRRLDLEERLWRTDSRGLARAEFQAWLLEQAEAAELSRADADTESPVELDNADGLWQVSTRLSADFRPQSLYRFLHRVESNAELTVIERLETGEAGESQAEMIIRGYYRIDDASS